MIRPMEERDSQAVRCISEEALGFKPSEELVRKNICRLRQDPKHFLLVYEEKGQVLAFLHAQEYENLYTESGLNLLGLAVLPEQQGKGIGKQLMACVEAEAKERGCHYIRINTREGRKSAHLFYESLGYCSETLQKRYMKAFSVPEADDEGR